MEKHEGLRKDRLEQAEEGSSAGSERIKADWWGKFPGAGRLNKGLLGSMTLAVAVALLFLAAASPSFLSAAALKNRKLPVYSVERDDKCVSLTFDAAWADSSTAEYHIDG